MRLITKGLFVSALAALTAFTMCATAKAEPPTNWLSYAGDGDFVPARQGLELTDDPVNIRLLWKNPTHTGIIKSGDGTALDAQKAGFDPAYGEAANLIVADGIVFCSWSQPSGKARVPRESVDHRYWSKTEKANLQDKFFSVDADWRTIALDAETGKKLWEKSEDSASMHFISGKRGHHGISGAYGHGMYVTMTILGEVLAYDASTGKLRWKTTAPEWHEMASKIKAELVQERRLLTTVGNSAFEYERSGLTIVGDVVVVPDLRGGIMGLRAKDGKQRWHVPQALESAAVPQPWVHKGKTWLLCNGPKGRDSDSSMIHLIDPETGDVAWSHESGANRGCLVFGDDHVLLNVRGNPQSKQDDWTKGVGLLACYRLSPKGLTEAWRFEDKPDNRYRFHNDAGAHRKGAIRDGVLYFVLGEDKNDRRLGSFDVATGKELHRGEHKMSGVNCQPILAEDMMYWQADGAHSGSFAGFIVYTLDGKGGFERQGIMKLKPNGIYRVDGYLHLQETPYYDGRFFVRGLEGIYAVDLRTVTKPIAVMELHGAWAGSPVPLEVRMFGGDDGVVKAAKVRPPKASELGIVFTTGRRSDGWANIQMHDQLIIGEGSQAEMTLGMRSFAWDAELEMAPTNRQWAGTWTRTIRDWGKRVTVEGKFGDNAKDGYEGRVFPTPWLKDQPMTKMGELAAGQRRMLLPLHAFLPKGDERKGMTACLDHDGEQFVSAVGGAFSFNQSWHEIDTSGLKLTEDGMSGQMLVIANPDPWWAPNEEAGTAIVARVEIDAKFGEPDGAGLRPITGTWKATWGESLTRTGKINAKVTSGE